MIRESVVLSLVLDMTNTRQFKLSRTFITSFFQRPNAFVKRSLSSVCLDMLLDIHSILSNSRTFQTLIYQRKKAPSPPRTLLLPLASLFSFSSVFETQMSESPILFEEIFEVRSVNPDGKAFEKGEMSPISLTT